MERGRKRKKRPGCMAEALSKKGYTSPLDFESFKFALEHVRHFVYKSPQKFYYIFGVKIARQRKKAEQKPVSNHGICSAFLFFLVKKALTGVGQQSCFGPQKCRKMA